MQEFIFTVIGNAMNMRTRLALANPFGANQALTLVPAVVANPAAIAATSTGQDLKVLLVYCLNAAWNIVELVGTLNGATYEWVSNVRDTVVRPNSKLAVTRTADGIALVYVGQDGFIRFRTKTTAGGAWGPGESQLADPTSLR